MNVVTSLSSSFVGTCHYWPHDDSFLPRKATRSAVLPRQVVCLSDCLSVTLRYRDHIGWNSANIISRYSIFDIWAAVSRKRCKIGSKLLLTTNRNMCTLFRLVPKSMTLDDVWARFKVIDSLNAAKMAKYGLEMTPTPCRVAGWVHLSIRHSCTYLLKLLT